MTTCCGLIPTGYQAVLTTCCSSRTWTTGRLKSHRVRLHLYNDDYKDKIDVPVSIVLVCVQKALGLICGQTKFQALKYILGKIAENFT